jgi:hypothetical protein
MWCEWGLMKWVGDYQKESAPPLSGTRPRIGYISIWPVNHQLIATDKQGGKLISDLILWRRSADFEKANNLLLHGRA